MVLMLHATVVYQCLLIVKLPTANTTIGRLCRWCVAVTARTTVNHGPAIDTTAEYYTINN
jgi:hypothetical protein